MLADSGLSVEALATTNLGPIAVRAYLFAAANGSARLCDAVPSRFDPSARTSRSAVIGLPPELVEGLDVAAGRRWSAEPLQLIGTVRARVFVDPEALAAS